MIAFPAPVGRRDDLASLVVALAAARYECRLVVVEGEPGAGKTALCKAFLEFASSLPDVRARYTQFPRFEQAAPRRAHLRMSALLGGLRSDRTTVLVLDDMEWGDPETVELLDGLMRRPGHVPVLVVATCCPSSATDTAAAVQRVMMDLASSGRCESLILSPMNASSPKDWCG
jgi:predicted ATPase